MRGMIKWKPFSTMLTNNDIILIEKKRNTIKKPSISTDQINEIDQTLKNAIHYNLPVQIKYFKSEILLSTQGNITNLNIIEKYILINSTRIYFKNIINIILLQTYQ